MTAVILLNMGGPESPGSVEPFLANLFGDPDIFRLPFQKRLAKFIARKRAPKVIDKYKLIGGGSPINYITEDQRRALAERLLESGNAFDVLVCMRYWPPMTQEVAGLIIRNKYERIVLLPLYPHYSFSTTGSSFNEFARQMKMAGAKKITGTDVSEAQSRTEKWLMPEGNETDIVYINDYHDSPLYIKALNVKISEALLSFSDIPEVHILFSAHGIPLSYVEKGDPYVTHINKTVELVMEARGSENNYSLSFQSRVGPVKWTGPYTGDTIKKLAGEGVKNILVVPVSFVSDHLETLYELDIEYRKIAVECGIEKYFVMPGLNTSPVFIDALTETVLNSVFT